MKPPLTETRRELLRQRVHLIVRELAALPKLSASYDREDRRAHDHAVAVLIRNLEQLPEGPATTRTRWDGSSIHMLDIRATSTSSLVGALRNWIAAAKKLTGDA